MKSILFYSLMPVLLLALLVMPANIVMGAEDDILLQGSWQGAIKILGQQLEIVVNFSEADGKLTATIDIPKQLVKNFPLQNVNYNNQQLYFEAAFQALARFEGVLADDGKISGSFLQSGYQGEFYLERVLESGEDKQSGQVPEENVEVYNLQISGGTINGTLRLPEVAVAGDNQVPVVLLIAGSGPTDRDGNGDVTGINTDTLKKIADLLDEQGVASVRYDKRGIAASKDAVQPEFAQDLRFEDFISDAAGFLRKLKKDDRFSRVAVLGHSQGSLVGMIAAHQVGIDAFISAAGAGTSIDQTLLTQLKPLGRELYNEAEKIIDSLSRGKVVKEVSKPLLSVFSTGIQPFLISYMQYDPVKEIAKLDIPVLIVQGTTDLQVSPEDARLLKEAYPGAVLEIIEGMNHILKEAPTNPQQNIATYTEPELLLAAEFKRILIDFVNYYLK